MTQTKPYRNPVAVAQEWQALVDSGDMPSRAALARRLGAARVHVTQVLLLLRLSNEAQQAVLSAGDPMQGRGIGEHALRSIVRLPAPEQEHRIRELGRRNGR